MDASMPQLTGIEAPRRIKASPPRVRVVDLSMHEDEDMATAMRVYLRKDTVSGVLIQAVLGSRLTDLTRACFDIPSEALGLLSCLCVTPPGSGPLAMLAPARDQPVRQ